MDRAQRIGFNEAVFREVNERLEDVNRAFGMVTETIEVVCECGDLHCAERILMGVPEYEALRARPDLFAVVPGHEIPDVEDVVERRGAYDVVEKHPGEPRAVAEETDPRRN